MGINYNLAVHGLEGLNLYFCVFLSAASGSAKGVKGAKGFTTAKTCSLLSRPSQGSDRGCHRTGPRLGSQCRPGMDQCGRGIAGDPCPSCSPPGSCRCYLHCHGNASPAPTACPPVSPPGRRSHAGLEPLSHHSPHS